jgi:hypothetical protein
MHNSLALLRIAEAAAANEEASLLQSARADPAAFARIYERYLPRVHRYCLRRLDAREEAEDVPRGAKRSVGATAGLHPRSGWTCQLQRRLSRGLAVADRPSHRGQRPAGAAPGVFARGRAASNI